MYIVKKKIKGLDYLYIYKSQWRDGKPRNIYVDYIGPDNPENRRKAGKITKKKPKPIEEDSR